MTTRFSSENLDRHISDRRRNKWMQKVAGILATAQIREAEQIDFILRQMMHELSLAFLDGMISQLEKQSERLREVMR